MTALFLYSCQVVLAGLLQKTEYIHFSFDSMFRALTIKYILLHSLVYLHHWRVWKRYQTIPLYQVSTIITKMPRFGLYIYILWFSVINNSNIYFLSYFQAYYMYLNLAYIYSQHLYFFPEETHTPIISVHWSVMLPPVL